MSLNEEQEAYKRYLIKPSCRLIVSIVLIALNNQSFHSFLETEQVVIDHLCLFLRISDVLITLLIRDLQIADDLKGTLPNKKKENHWLNIRNSRMVPVKSNLVGLLTKNPNG